MIFNDRTVLRLYARKNTFFYYLAILTQKILRFYIYINTRHIHGPKEIESIENDVFVFGVVRNEEDTIRHYIKHYTVLGVKHIFLLDNGSNDNTIKIASEYENTTIYFNNLAFYNLQMSMRQFLLSKHGRNKWCLVVDGDELFDYPGSDVIGLDKFISYLVTNKYTAVVGQMLDMFADEELNNIQDNVEIDILKKYPYYDISSIERRNYIGFDKSYDYILGRNILKNPEIKCHVGGIRKKIFNLNFVWLTKHPLFFCKSENCFVQPHLIMDHTIADVTCLLLHFKFTSNFIQSILEKGLRHGWILDYKYYFEKTDKTKSINLKSDTSVKYINIDQLIESNFIVISDNYRNFIRTN